MSWEGWKTQPLHGYVVDDSEDADGESLGRVTANSGVSGVW